MSRWGWSLPCAALAITTVLGCDIFLDPKLPSGVRQSELQYAARPLAPRDAKRPEAKFDREAAFLSEVKKGKASGAIPPAYRDGDCAAAPNPDLQKFCLGEFKEVMEPDLVRLGFATRSTICHPIKDVALQRYCSATTSDNTIKQADCFDAYAKDTYEEKYTFLCYAYFGSDWGKYRDLPRGGYTSSTPAPAAGPSPGPAPAACKRKGAPVSGANECCNGAAEFNPNASNADRASGRDQRCTQ